MPITPETVLDRLARGLASAMIGLALLAPSAAYAATIAVTTTADVINPADGLCSLREAIIAANTDTASGAVAGECPAGTGADQINLPAGTYTLTIAATGANDATSGNLNITQPLAIVGTGNPTVTGGGGWADGIFSVASGVPVSMSGFTISGGNRAIATGVDGGGGIHSDGPLTLTSMTISGNAVTQTGNALGPGGGIFIGAAGSLTITNSTISGNTSQSVGAGLYSQSTVNMSGTTVSGNNSAGANTGTGGVLIFLSAPASTALITNSTIANNTAGSGFGSAGGIDIEANGGTPRTATLRNVTISGNSNPTVGGLSSFGNQMVLTLIDTLVAGNTGSTNPDCSNQASATITSGGNNLVGNNTGCTIANLQPSDRVGTSGTPINPLLGPLAGNGGPTRTMALLAGSPAINAGNNSTCPATDQRGFARPAGVSCDIGAFEAGAVEGVVPVVEFYNAQLDHYFITWVVDEIATLDAGIIIKGWTRTGKALKTYTKPQPGTSPVCRYYIPPGLGDSHFFGRGTVECNATGQKNPSFFLEDPAFMQMFLPSGGVCPANTTQVYRVFSNRADANHRYMTDKSVRDQMAGLGWLIEGDGPDAVVMCAPQ